MEVPTRGATCRCASVSGGFLHRNCVLSVPSRPPLAAVLSQIYWSLAWSRKVWTVSFLKSWLFVCHCHCLSASFISLTVLACSVVAAIIRVSCTGVTWSHIHSWTSSVLTNWLIKLNDLYFFLHHFWFPFEKPAMWWSFPLAGGV